MRQQLCAAAALAMAASPPPPLIAPVRRSEMKGIKRVDTGRAFGPDAIDHDKTRQDFPPTPGPARRPG